MATKDWRGCFAIPMTPFDKNDRIEEDVLAAEVNFCIESGVGGLVVPVMVSEFRLLSEEERRTMIRVSVQVCSGRVPVVANCAAVNTPSAASYARYAEETGADAVIAMPPYVMRPDFETIFAYYQAISDAVNIPVWIQNADVVALSTEQVVRLCTEIENVRWVKEEVKPSTHSISALVSKNCPAIEGIMGGSGGLYMITEWRRGSKGVLPACTFCDLIQKVWELLDEDKEDEARDLYKHLLPALILEHLIGMAFDKEIMIRRGVFKNNRVRLLAHPLDEDDMREIDRVWERIQPYLIWHK
ncbi:MAG TPA: dihydrodipicolinate synthase family protein [Dehalococcoidia bacterium]|nr:dihydrodipicolinate synthase family protein [Dehalococcoidia bacterium]